jgi:hypothetical protein
MKRFAPVVVVLLWVSIAIAQQSPLVEQQTSGSCSPAINGNGNTVYCPDVDQRALDHLNELLDLRNLQFQQKIVEANHWARKYRELNQLLTDSQQKLAAQSDDTTLVQASQDLLHEGKLEEADKIFSQLNPQHTEGPGSPAIIGGHNKITIILYQNVGCTGNHVEINTPTPRIPDVFQFQSARAKQGTWQLFGSPDFGGPETGGFGPSECVSPGFTITGAAIH